MKRQRLNHSPELIKQDNFNGSGLCPSSRPARVAARSRGPGRRSISNVTDEVLPSDCGIDPKYIKSLNKSDDLVDELYPSPKSNKPRPSITKAQRKRSKKESSSTLTTNEENNAKRGRYANQMVVRVREDNTSSEIKDRETCIDKEMSAKRLSASGGRRNYHIGRAENENLFNEIETDQVNDFVDLDASVSSVEVSEDEKDEKVATRCDWCKKKFNEKDWGKLNRHKKLSHDTPCPDCDVMFVDKIDLAKHTKEYHRKRDNYAYQCRKCLKKNQTFKGNLKHEELEHPHKCRLCIVEKIKFPFSFINKQGLEVHIREKHRSNTLELDKISLSTEDDTFEVDEIKESVESAQLVVVRPKIMKQKKVSSGSKAKSSKETDIKPEEMQENVEVKIYEEINNPESRENADNKLPIDYSKFIKNESIIEEGNQDNDCVSVMDTLGSNKEMKLDTVTSIEEIKMDYSQFIINESLQDNGIDKSASKHVKQEENVSKVEIKARNFDNQSNSNSVASKLSVDVVKTEFKEMLVEREAIEKGTDLLVNNVVLKRESDDKIQDSAISTTSQIISKELSDENFNENCITDCTDDKSENNNQDGDNQTCELPRKSLSLPLVNDDRCLNFKKEVSKVTQNCKERQVSTVEKLKQKEITILSKVNGILEVTKSSRSKFKKIGRIPGDINSSEKMVIVDNKYDKVEGTIKIDEDSTHMSKEVQTLSIHDTKSNLLGTNDHPEYLADVSIGHKENLCVIEEHSEDSEPPENLVSSVCHMVSILDCTTNSMDGLESQSSVNCKFINKSTKNDVHENLDGDLTFCPSHLNDTSDDDQSSAPERNFMKQPSNVPEEDSTIDEASSNSSIDETSSNDCTIEENIQSHANNESIVLEPPLCNDNLVMKNESTEREPIFENVTPYRSSMSKVSNGLNLISTMYLNTSSETDSPYPSHLPEVLVSDSPIGEPIGSSCPRQLKAESIPMKINKLHGIQPVKDSRPTREVWKVGKPETKTVTHDIATIKGDDNDMNGGQCNLDAKDLNDSLDEFGLDVIDSPAKKKETYDISNLLQLSPKYSTLEPEKEKPKQLERDRTLTDIEELLESDEDDDKRLISDVENDQHSRKKKQNYEVSVKTDGKPKIKMKEEKETSCFPCLYCDRTFNRESLLKNHMHFAHYISSKDSFVCNLCQHHFKYKGHLNDHLKIRHDYRCENCSLRFHTRSQMERHSIDAHPYGSMDLIDSRDNDDGLEVKPLECELCKAVFPWEEFLKHTELSHTFPCSLQLDPEANNAPHLWFVSDNDLAWHVYRDHDGPKPNYKEKPEETSQSEMEISNPEKFPRKHDFFCELDGQEFDNQQVFEHKKRSHKRSLGSDMDQYARFSNLTKEFESVTCCLCGLEFEEVQQFEKHSRILHPFACSHGNCQKRFTNQKNLSDHLTKDHSVIYLNVYGKKDAIKLTATRSIANIEMVRSVEEWIRSEDVVKHLVRVMKGELRSRRHELFMDRKERANSGGLNPSKLYGLSNPAFMGDAGERDSSIVQFLIDEVFNAHFNSSDPRLQEIGINCGFTYATTVLFPEMILNQHQVQNGFSRAEAERAFMEIEITDEEREGLEQEIRDGVVAREEEEYSEDEWVDAPDMIENYYENSTIIVDDSE